MRAGMPALPALTSALNRKPLQTSVKTSSRPALSLRQFEVEHDGVVVGEDFARGAAQVSDDARRLRGVGRDVSAREPVELERAAPALIPQRPLYPPEAPARNPLAHVRVRREVFHVVVQSARARLVQLAEAEAARVQLSEE